MKNTSITPSVQYDSIAAALMYQEFRSIPGNPFSFSLPENCIVSAEMMRTMLQTAYRVKGWDYVEC